MYRDTAIRYDTKRYDIRIFVSLDIPTKNCKISVRSSRMMVYLTWKKDQLLINKTWKATEKGREIEEVKVYKKKKEIL